MIDIIMVTYNRVELTKKSLESLFKNTDLPFRLIVVDNNSTDGTKEFLLKQNIDILIFNKSNLGLEVALNQALGLVESELFVVMDNDILVPPNWLSQQLAVMKKYPNFAALARRPQILIGVSEIFRGGQEVVENNLVGGVARMMRLSAIKGIGGWTKKFENSGRGNEEWDICPRLIYAGWKIGYISNQWAYHQFGDNHWGYKNVDYRMGRRLEEAPKDIPFDPLTCEPSVKYNE